MHFSRQSSRKVQTLTAEVRLNSRFGFRWKTGSWSPSSCTRLASRSLTLGYVCPGDVWRLLESSNTLDSPLYGCIELEYFCVRCQKRLLSIDSGSRTEQKGPCRSWGIQLQLHALHSETRLVSSRLIPHLTHSRATPPLVVLPVAHYM
jgi:hypothetical protein